MNLHEWLVARAHTYWENDEQLPLDLFAEMVSAGICVEAEETNFQFNNQD